MREPIRELRYAFRTFILQFRPPRHSFYLSCAIYDKWSGELILLANQDFKLMSNVIMMQCRCWPTKAINFRSRVLRFF